MAKNVELVTETTEREIIFTHNSNAPRKEVFKAWIDPKLLSQWWGPKDSTSPVCEVDARPGGYYRIVNRAPDGVDYPLKGTYLEVIEPERIVCTGNTDEHPQKWHDLLDTFRAKGESKRAGEFQWIVTFEENKGITKMTIRTRFSSVSDHDALLKMGMMEGWSQSLERLDALMAKK